MAERVCVQFPGLLPGFKTYPTHHCVTGSMLHIYRFHDVEISEDMLLGLGAGLGFFFWRQKGMPPMILGRGNVHRPGVDGLEIDVGRRTGVGIERFITGSRKKAEQALIDQLAAGEPVMIHVDMGYLPYFDLPEDYHFGGHVVVVAGRSEAEQGAYIADRDDGIHTLSWQTLLEARGSIHKPFPPHNTWYSFDFSGQRPPRSEDLYMAIGEVCQTMLEGPISNLGVRGIRRTAQEIRSWPEQMDIDALRWACFNNYLFVDATGGTGGGLFRYMYARFLKEAEAQTGEPVFREQSIRLHSVADSWQRIAAHFFAISEGDLTQPALDDIAALLVDIAGEEEQIWTTLRDRVGRPAAGN